MPRIPDALKKLWHGKNKTLSSSNSSSSGGKGSHRHATKSNSGSGSQEDHVNGNVPMLSLTDSDPSSPEAGAWTVLRRDSEQSDEVFVRSSSEVCPDPLWSHPLPPHYSSSQHVHQGVEHGGGTHHHHRQNSAPPRHPHRLQNSSVPLQGRETEGQARGRSRSGGSCLATHTQLADADGQRMMSSSQRSCDGASPRGPKSPTDAEKEARMGSMDGRTPSPTLTSRPEPGGGRASSLRDGVVGGGGCGGGGDKDSGLDGQPGGGSSMTSDYGSMTHSRSSMASDVTAACSGPEAPEVSLLSLERLVLAGDRSETCSSGSFSSYNTGVQTVIQKRPSNQSLESSQRGATSSSSGGSRQSYTTRTVPIWSLRSTPRSGPATPGVSPVTVPCRMLGGPSGSAPTSTSSSSSVASPLSPEELVSPFYPANDVAVGEMFPQSALSTPIGALRKSRTRLCLMLNIEQVRMVNDLCPDYRGLADMLGFDSVEVANFWERNPSDTLFMEWARCRDGRLLPAKLGVLVDSLERLERHDVLNECRGVILEDARDFIAEQHMLRRYTVQNMEHFDCYVNIADQDILTIGREILDTLEGVYGLRLCLTLRDVTVGGSEFDAMAEMLETRCNSKVLIVLTKSFENSDACQFLVQFAVTLDPGSRKNKLIPLLVDEDVEVPRVLRCLAMLNYYRDKRLGFLWPKLKHAISL